jgi:hypothetical protein
VPKIVPPAPGCLNGSHIHGSRGLDVGSTETQCELLGLQGRGRMLGVTATLDHSPVFVREDYQTSSSRHVAVRPPEKSATITGPT